MTFGTKVQFSALTLLVAAVLASGCSKSSPTAPSGLDLTGAWTGFLGANSNDGSAVTWTATQSGSSPTGPIVLRIDADNGVFFNITGTLAGAVSGAQVAWTLTLPAGAFTAAGSPTCSVTGTGTSNPTTSSSITVVLTLNFAPACVGTVTEGASQVEQLSLTK